MRNVILSCASHSTAQVLRVEPFLRKLARTINQPDVIHCGSTPRTLVAI